MFFVISTEEICISKLLLESILFKINIAFLLTLITLGCFIKGLSPKVNPPKDDSLNLWVPANNSEREDPKRIILVLLGLSNQLLNISNFVKIYSRLFFNGEIYSLIKVDGL